MAESFKGTRRKVEKEATKKEEDVRHETAYGVKAKQRNTHNNQSGVKTKYSQVDRRTRRTPHMQDKRTPQVSRNRLKITVGGEGGLGGREDPLDPSTGGGRLAASATSMVCTYSTVRSSVVGMPKGKWAALGARQCARRRGYRGVCPLAMAGPTPSLLTPPPRNITGLVV